MKNALLPALVPMGFPSGNKVLFLKLLIPLLIAIASCSRQQKPATLTPVRAHSGDMLPHVGRMYQKIKDSIDVAHVTMITGVDNVRIYMSKFKSNPNRIYAVTSLGDEIMYAGVMQNDMNGRMAVLKEGEAVLITVKDGVTEITGLDPKEWTYYFTTQFHGGSGFCQRMAGESFSTCYKAEADEFCDSFISCIAVSTQPIVAIAIAAACSCKAKPPVVTPHYWWDTARSDTDTVLRFNRDSLLQLPIDALP
jgi:hypothetical protein